MREKAQPSRPLSTEVVAGIGMGLAIAVLLALVAAIRLALGGQGTPWREVLGAYGWVVVFYLVSGIAGGTIYGLLAPIRHLYIGKYLTAYLILMVVYGGGAIVVSPLFGAGPAPVGPVLVICAILALFLAPLYVRLLKD